MAVGRAESELGLGGGKISSNTFIQLVLPLPGVKPDRKQPTVEVDKPRVSFGSLASEPGSALTNTSTEVPRFGTTFFGGNVEVTLTQGNFNLSFFDQTDIGKDVVVLWKGDLRSADPILVRVHSECITSESCGGCDCDCVVQLNDSLAKIAEEGRGVVIYTPQEGRGAGLCSKGPDRQFMFVVANDPNITPENRPDTFDAYHGLGIVGSGTRGDTRDYSVVRALKHLLGLPDGAILMSNNPDKEKQLTSNGFTVTSRVDMPAKQTPQNTSYLESKKGNGHAITELPVESCRSPWDVQPLQPRKLAGDHNAERFTQVCEYPFSVHQSPGVVILHPRDQDQIDPLFWSRTSNVFESRERLSNGIERLVFDPSKVADNPELADFISHHPIWFKFIPYRDQVTKTDFVGLVHPPVADNSTPIVRVHFESIFDRFPLHNDIRRNGYKRSIVAIAEQGNGGVFLYPKDCQGNEIFYDFKVRQGKMRPEEIADRRDYDAVALLIREHYGQGPIQLVYCSSEESVSPRLVEALSNLGIRAEPLDLDNVRTD